MTGDGLNGVPVQRDAGAATSTEDEADEWSVAAAEDPLTALTAGDPMAARTLRTNLAEIARQHRGEPLAGTIERVLAGRAAPSELVASEGFMSIVGRGVRELAEARDSLSPEQRREWLASAEGTDEDARRP